MPQQAPPRQCPLHPASSSLFYRASLCLQWKLRSGCPTAVLRVCCEGTSQTGYSRPCPQHSPSRRPGRARRGSAGRGAIAVCPDCAPMHVCLDRGTGKVHAPYGWCCRKACWKSTRRVSRLSRNIEWNVKKVDQTRPARGRGARRTPIGCSVAKLSPTITSKASWHYYCRQPKRDANYNLTYRPRKHPPLCASFIQPCCQSLLLVQLIPS